MTQITTRRTKLLFIMFALAITYLVANTGLVSDDFEAMLIRGGLGYIDMPVLYATHLVWYRLFDIDNQALLNILKILYIFGSFYMISRFFSLYLDDEYAMAAAFLFLFFPSHDAATYWFMSQYLTLSFAFYLFAFFLACRDRLAMAFISALIASFMSYGSTPLAIGLCALFLLQREFKKGLVIILPNIIYAVYFIPLNIVMRMGAARIVEKFSFEAFFKQLLLQTATFSDSIFGPSMWLKVYYAFRQLSPESFLIAFILFLVFCGIKSGPRFSVKPVLGLAIVLLASFAMFAATGRYPQIAFNLGNRVTIYGALLITYLAAAFPMPRPFRLFIFAVIVFSAFGISDHWKAWNVRQTAVIKRISRNQDLKNYVDKRVVYVSGNQYSAYGPLRHIEFFSETPTPSFIFRIIFRDRVAADTINRRFNYVNGDLIDTKYGNSAKVDGHINVYDSEKDRLFKVDAGDINNYIESLPAENRHWVQMLKGSPFRGIVLKLMPRLKYAL